MRWPIRNQILVPFAVMQIIAAIVVSVSSAWVGVQSPEKLVPARLDSVLETLQSSIYPLTSNILMQLSQLSGAHFALFDEDGQLLSSTLSAPINAPPMASIPAVKPSQMDNLPVMSLGGDKYFVGYASRRMGPSASRIIVLYPEKPWREARWQAAVVPLRWGGLVLMLTLLTSLWLARRIAKRVQAVQQHVCRIATGDFQPVPSSVVDDELRDLTQAVNQMATALQQSMQRIRENERTAMLAQLASGLAHNLRNALTGARVSIQLHQRHCSQPNDQANMVALSELQRAEEHIKALLRIAQGKSTSSRPLQLTAILDEIATVTRPLCEHRSVDFEFLSDNSDCQAADSDALRGGLLNLVTNAIEAAGPGGQGSLESRRAQNTIVVSVIDDGPGIPTEHLAEVFNPFFTTKEEGVGIGLPVAKHAAEDCGGTLSVSRANGRTIFEMNIPVRQAADPPPTPAATPITQSAGTTTAIVEANRE